MQVQAFPHERPITLTFLAMTDAPARRPDKALESCRGNCFKGRPGLAACPAPEHPTWPHAAMQEKLKSEILARWQVWAKEIVGASAGVAAEDERQLLLPATQAKP